VSSHGSAAAGTPSTSEYEFITEPAPAVAMAVSNDGRITSMSSRRPIDTGPWLRAAREAEYPAKCFSVAMTPALCRPRT
jgi:hypothetical protein